MRKLVFLMAALVCCLVLPLTGHAASEQTETPAPEQTQAPEQTEDPQELQDEIEEEWRREMEESLEVQLDDLDLSRLEEALSSLEQQGKEAIGAYSVRQMIEEIAAGEMEFSAESVLGMLGKVFLQQVAGNWSLILKAIVIALLSSLLLSLRNSFGSEGVSEVAYYVCYLFIMLILVQSIVSVVSVGTEAIRTMVTLMQGAFPVLLTLLTALGGSVSAGIFQPAMALLSGSVATLIQDFILPVVLVCSVLVILSNISERIQIKRLAGLAKSSCTWVIGVVFTVYVAILAIQGMTAASIDGISIRTAKYAIDKLVPVAGKMFSDTVDTFLGCSLILKNAIGVAALLISLVSIGTPVIQILVNVFMFRVMAAIIEPITDKRLSDCLYELSNVLVLLLIIVLAVGLMLFITIGLLMAAGNTNVMLR